MSKKTETPNVDKIEQQRLEREARIKRLKGKDGYKKQIKSRGKAFKIITPILLTLVILIVLVWGAFSLGLVHRLVSPMSVGDEKVSLVEYNYHYASYYQTYNQYAAYGLAPADANGNLDLSAETGIEGYASMSWGDYLNVITQQSIQQVVAFAEAAEEAGITLSEDSEEAIDQFFENYRVQIPTDFERNNYYEQIYGRGASETNLRPVLVRTMIANQYASEYPETYDISDAEIESYYDENKDTYDVVDYRLYTMSIPAAPEGATDEDKEELAEETEAKAEEMLDELTDFDSMRDVVLKYIDGEDVEYRQEDLTLYSNRRLSRIGNSMLSEWLFDEVREHNDKEVLSSGNNYYVIVFGERGLSDEGYPSVRHILFEAREESATDEELEAAEAAAEEALAQVTDEDSMIALSESLLEAEEAAVARLYENVSRGTMTTAFENWIYDLNNEAGDTGIVQTEYGFHVMYLVGRSEEPIWYLEIESQLRNEAFGEDTDSLIEEDRFEVSVSNFGVWLADRG